jgi:aromatic ring-opening dioxygenase catalytic subunit (LigB family)
MSAKALPTFFIPHGGGPCFFMDWSMGPKDTWDEMAHWLKNMRHQIGAVPKAILVISGHWEDKIVQINANPNPPLLFDYYGFPEHTYKLTYPAPGSPELAQQVQALLAQAGIASGFDTERGFDHGVFVPFKLMFPEAEIPVVQISLQQDLDPQRHFEIGQALAPLREQGVLIVGSGMSFHNLRTFGQDVSMQSGQFDDWLSEAVAQPDAAERNRRLAHWAEAPYGRLAHPREEHLLPLMVVAGAAGQDQGKKVFGDKVMNWVVSAYQFGEAA